MPLERGKLLEWCRVPREDLPARAKIELRILPATADVHRLFAQEMLDELKANNAAGRPTRWIIPVGPTGQYPLLIDACNRERISWRSVHAFAMDEYLDWEGRPLPLEHRFSFQGFLRRQVFARLDPELCPPESQVHYPSPYALDASSEAIAQVGGIDTCWGGIGYNGHIAFNEPPRWRWHLVTPEQFRNSKTRVLALADDTTIVNSLRNVGGLSAAMPPMAITLGMSDLLAARRIRLYAEGGVWKQVVLRAAVLGEVTTEFPVTFCQEHPDCVITVDEATAACPPLEGI